uniref:MULE domain-containing protein n=1 Tax=Syphacia muris TaxID=451379 RepID=A0A0N5ANP1_9BILA
MTNAEIETLRDSCEEKYPSFAVYDSKLDASVCYSFMYLDSFRKPANFQSFIQMCKNDSSELLTVNSDEEVLFITGFLNPILKKWRLTLRFQYDPNSDKIIPKASDYATKLVATLDTEACFENLCCIFLSANKDSRRSC